MTRKKLSNVAAASDVDGLPILGKLVTYSIPDEPVSGTKLVRSWAANGLDVDLLPDQRSGSHVFQSACRSVETRRKGGKGAEVKVDEVVNNSVEVVYQITHMVRDEVQRVIEHPKAMTIAFDKKLDTITVRELEDYDTLRELEEQIRKNFAKNAKTIPGQKVRNSVRELLLKVGAQNMRRKAGGLYFVPPQYRTLVNGRGETQQSAPILEGLAGVLVELYGERGDFWTIPLIDDTTSKAMVAKHFAINVNDRARETMERALQRVRQAKTNAKEGKTSNPVRADLLANLYNERRAIVGAIAQFEEMVGIEQNEVQKNLADLDQALEKLQLLADAS